MDLAALLVACLSLMVGTLALGWQVVAWFFDGPQVRTTLKHGVIGRGSVAAGVVESDGQPRDLSMMRSQGWNGPEVIGVEVTNVGRSRVQVTGISVDADRGGLTVAFPQGMPASPALPHWIEPQSSATWYADAEDARALIATVRNVVDGDAQSVRMTVELGNGRKVQTRRKLIMHF